MRARLPLVLLAVALALGVVVAAVSVQAPAPPRAVVETRLPSPFFPAHRASNAVLAWLQDGDPATLRDAVTACLDGKRQAPGNVFHSFLLAFCYAQMNDPAREESVKQADFPDAVHVYEFLFREHRATLPEALRLLPAYKCYCQRQEVGHLDKPRLCPVDGAPYTRDGDRYACAACDAVLDPARMPALMPVYEQATQDVLSQDRIAGWREQPGDPVTAADLFHMLGFRKGQVIADIGCGLGNFTFPFAREAGPDGKVYAEEIDPGFLDVVAYGVKSTGASNVIPVLGRIDDVGIPAESVDRVFLCEVYKSATINTGNLEPAEFERSVASFFGSLHRALKDDGQLVVVNKRNPALGMAAGPIRERLEGLGFRLVRSLEDFPREDILFFEKSAGPAALRRLRFNELLQGILLLEQSPHAVSSEQAHALADVIQGRNPDQAAGCYVRLVTAGLLTEAQKEYLARRYREVRATPNYIYRPPGQEDRRRYCAALAARAGGEAEPLTTPPDFVCEDVDGAKPVPYADLMVQFQAEVDADPKLRPSDEQVRRLLPSFEAYQEIVYTEESLIFDVLSAEQEAWLEQNRQRIPPQPTHQKRFEKAVLDLADRKGPPLGRE